MPGSLYGQSIRLEVISGQNIKVPSERIPAGIYVSIKFGSTRLWKSAIRVLSSDESAASSHVSPQLSLEIRASFELGRMLGNGELIGKLETSWDELLRHGNEPFDLSFPPICGVHPSLMLKAAVIHPCDNQDGALFDSVIACEIAPDTDAGHTRFAEYMTRKKVSDVIDVLEHFQLVLERCPVGHFDRAAALTNLASHGPAFEGHLDRPPSLYNLAEALTWRYDETNTAADIRESAQVYHELLPLYLEGTRLRSIAAGKNGVDYVIRKCNKLPTDASDEGICLRRISQDKSHDLDEAISLYEDALRLNPVRHKFRDTSLDNLGGALCERFNQRGDIDDINRAIGLRREALTLHPPGHQGRDTTLNNLALALRKRYMPATILTRPYSCTVNQFSYRAMFHGATDIFTICARRSALDSRKLRRLKMLRGPLVSAKNH
ncbi:hypothetical protein DFH29DRAFT_1067749 [Suillus ampliporus]|nr:hypothetical protein DFH29DRAFT_1067749 [Suillus ampliporus]